MTAVLGSAPNFLKRLGMMVAGAEPSLRPCRRHQAEFCAPRTRQTQLHSRCKHFQKDGFLVTFA